VIISLRANRKVRSELPKYRLVVFVRIAFDSVSDNCGVRGEQN